MQRELQYILGLYLSVLSVCLSVFLSVSVCVCLFVCLSVYSRTTGYETAYERYQQLQCYKGMKNNVAFFAETTAFERYGTKTSEKANMHNQHWLTPSRFSPFSAPWTNLVTKGIWIHAQRCSKPTYDHAASL